MAKISAETIDNFKAAGGGELYGLNMIDTRLALEQIQDFPDFRVMATQVWDNGAEMNFTAAMADRFLHVNSKTAAIPLANIEQGFQLFLMMDQTFIDQTKARWALLDAQPPTEPN